MGLLYHFDRFSRGCDMWHSSHISTFGPLVLWLVTNRIFNQNFDRFFSWRGIQHLFPGCQWVLDILLMIVVSRVDVNKFLNNDKKIFLKLFFFEPFLTCDQSQCDVWHWPKLGPDHRPCDMWLAELIKMVQYILVPMQNPYCRVWVWVWLKLPMPPYEQAHNEPILKINEAIGTLVSGKFLLIFWILHFFYLASVASSMDVKTGQWTLEF